jgi:hypothetical protein
MIQAGLPSNPEKVILWVLSNSVKRLKEILDKIKLLETLSRNNIDRELL